MASMIDRKRRPRATLSRRASLVAVLACGLVAASFGTAGAIKPVKSYKDIKTQPIQWEKPQAEVVTLKNGATLYMVENHRLPLINFEGMVRTGSLYDPPGKAGTASLLGTLLRTGGTAKRSWEQVDGEVDRLGMDVFVGVETENGNASFSVLTENLEPALQLLFEMLREPAIDAEKLALAKDKVKEGIRRQNDNPIQIAVREMRKIVAGPDHPRGFSPTFQTVDAVERKDLIDFHQRYYFPKNMILGIAGDFDRARIVQQIEAAMGDWPNREATWPDVKPLVTERPMGLYQADKATATQSTILLSKLLVKQGHADQYPLEVMDNIFGSGGFSSRVTQSVRNDRGLAYAAGSFLQVGRLDVGSELIYAMTKSESTIEALEVIRSEMAKMRNEAVAPEELNRAKSALVNSAVFDYDRPEKVLSQTIDLAYYGLPQDLPETRLAALQAITREDVQRVAKTHLTEDGFQILVVGSVEKFDKPLSSMGEVKTIELKDPTLP